MTSFKDIIKKAENRVKGQELSVKFSRAKYEKILEKLNADDDSDENTSETEESSFDEQRDLKEQAKMLKKIVEEQTKKEAAEMQKLEEIKQRAEEEENQKQTKEQEIMEILLTEEELQKVRKFLKEQEIDVLSPAIQKILEQGPGNANQQKGNSLQR